MSCLDMDGLLVLDVILDKLKELFIQGIWNNIVIKKQKLFALKTFFYRQEETCPSGLSGWRYLNEDLEWKDNGNIYMDCAT